jgi:hypothetical protein
MTDNGSCIITDLKFLSKIKKDEKFNIKYRYIQEVGLLTTLSRTFYNRDNRDNTLNFINETIEKGFALINDYKDSKKVSEQQLSKYILEDIIGAKKGINNLMKTYSDDVMFCCILESYLQKIDTTISELFATNCELFKNIDTCNFN